MKKRINITIDERVLERIDAYCKEKGLDRSTFLVVTASNFIEEKERSETIKQIKAMLKNSDKLKEQDLSSMINLGTPEENQQLNEMFEEYNDKVNKD